ncbi:MAG: cation-translocating P-type ATPase [Deltaproteobacteria bacterium]|nr:cation-translocating P-type ATPase [Deltaproteobacteria bacterium]
MVLATKSQERTSGPSPAVLGAGLSSAEALRLLKLGRNELVQEKGRSLARIFLSQFKGAMVWLLVAATIISAVAGERIDAIAIAVILVLNAVVGFLQEFRAEKAVLALKKMTAARARALRDGHVVEVPAAEIVPGDVLALDAGDVVAADGQVIAASRLEVNEAALTGESVGVEKHVGDDAPGTALAERHGQLFAGTAVAGGSGRALVTSTGMATELGKIAKLLDATADQTTPLQKRLETVGRTLLVLCLGIVVVVAVVGFFRGVPLPELLLLSVSLAVAAVPEGLAAIVTIALAVGVKRMVKERVLIRRLPAVETLGCTTVVCTDKTGTLTTGKMAVREVWGADRARAVDVAAASSDAELAPDERSGTGDPTEVALLVEAASAGLKRADIEATRARTETFPFDAERKRMSVLRSDGVLYVKGAVDLMLPLCTSGSAGAVEANAEMAGRGLRVLAVAVGRSRQERDLELVGLIGLADPPRPEAIAAVAAAREAGVRTVMITGDHPATARAIALEMGILLPGEDAAEIVHARATPQDKLDVVRRWKERGAVVAMTGDGVNDAPALKEAHIGIAMGLAGTEVTREAADMVLVDDNFASIIAAIREGRGVYENIQKALVYLLGGNVGELMIMLVAMAAGLPLPLTALQILWVNLVTDGMPALALVTDPTGKDALARRPRRTDEPILGRREWTSIVLSGVVTAACSLAVFVWALKTRDEATARNLAFSTLVFGQLFRAFAARSADKTLFEVGALQNLWLLLVVVVSVALQLGIHHVPLLQGLFGIEALSLTDCALSLGVGLIPVTVIELAKLVRRALQSRAVSP